MGKSLIDIDISLNNNNLNELQKEEKNEKEKNDINKLNLIQMTNNSNYNMNRNYKNNLLSRNKIFFNSLICSVLISVKAKSFLPASFNDAPIK